MVTKSEMRPQKRQRGGRKLFSDSGGGASAAPGNSVSRLSVTFKRDTHEKEDRRRKQAHAMNNINISVVIRRRVVESCDQTIDTC